MTNDRVNILIIFVASAIITLPIALFGVPKGNDLPQHFQFALTFRDSLADGVIYPPWAAEVNSGFGDVGVRFYPPLAYYLLVGSYALLSDWVYATAVTTCLLFFFGGLGVYLWCREWFGPVASLVAGSIYVFVPYHVNEIYNAFTFAEFAAACILPFCFLYATRVVSRGSMHDVIGLAVSFAALILTNLPMVVIGSVTLGIYSLALLSISRRFAPVGRFSISVALSLLLSSFYWARMIPELSFVSHFGNGFTSGDYDFRSNFVWSFSYASADQYSERTLGFLDLMLLVTLAMAVAALVTWYLRSTKGDRLPIAGATIVLITGLLFATPVSAFLWEKIELLQRTQFPWRWLTVVSLACCVLVAGGIDKIKGYHDVVIRRLGMIIVGSVIAAAAFTVAQVIRPAIFLDPASFDKTVEGMATVNSCECWWPVWARKAAIADLAPVAAGTRNTAIESWQPTYRRFRVSAGSENAARVATFYYPNWRARVNERDVQIMHDDNGAIIVPLAAEDSQVELYFEEPALGRRAAYLSIAGWISLLGLSVYRVTRIRHAALD